MVMHYRITYLKGKLPVCALTLAGIELSGHRVLPFRFFRP